MRKIIIFTLVLFLMSLSAQAAGEVITPSVSPATTSSTTELIGTGTPNDPYTADNFLGVITGSCQPLLRTSGQWVFVNQGTAVDNIIVLGDCAYNNPVRLDETTGLVCYGDNVYSVFKHSNGQWTSGISVLRGAGVAVS